MSKIVVDSIGPNDGKKLSFDGDVTINGNLIANTLSISSQRKILLELPRWSRNANEFEFIFQTYNWSTLGDPTSSKKPWSQDINPKTGSPYRIDFLKNIDSFITDTRVIWMDDDSSKYYDWNFSFYDLDNPPLHIQSWPDGLVLTNTFGINPWNNTTVYGVGSRIIYNGFIWECNISNSNQIPTYSNPLTDYWHDTGIPENTGFNYRIPIYYDVYKFNQFDNQSGQNLFYAGSGGYINGIKENWQLSKGLTNTSLGKKPVVTLNVFLNSTNSNRYSQLGNPFDDLHQVDMLDAIRKEVLAVDMIQLGSNIYNIGQCIPGPIPPNPFVNGYQYGSDMINYVKRIRTNNDATTSSAKIIIQSTEAILNSQNNYADEWVYDSLNPLNQNKGFIHGFYNNQQGNPVIYDFDIISFQTSFGYERLINYYDSLAGTAPYSWSVQMGPWPYMIMKNTILDCKDALSLYNKQNQIKYWYRYMSNTSPFGSTVPQGITPQLANYCWATQTGVFIAMILAATDRDFVGFQYNSIVDYIGCNLSLLYTSTDTFGPNTTDVMDYTPVGWMFNRFLNYFKAENGALTYNRILQAGGQAFGYTTHGFSLGIDFVVGVHIVSNGINNPVHRVIICNYNMDDNYGINLDLSQIIKPWWTNVQFQKIYTPTMIHEPVNWYRPGGNYEAVIEDPPYAPTVGQINSTTIYPTEYLMITAD